MSGAQALFSADAESSPFWQSRKLAYAVLLLAFVLRLVLLSWPPFYTGIEEMHTPSSIAYMETGHFDPDNDYSSPFRKILQYPTLKLLGDTAVARRLPNVIFGSLTAFFLVLLGQQLFPRRRVGLIAGLFLAVDPFHISFSRTTWEDIPAALFLMAGAYFLTKALNQVDSNRYVGDLLKAGLALALALATRRYIAIIIVAVIAFLIYRELKGPATLRSPNPKRRLLFIVVVFGLLPLTAYLLTFYPWMSRGYSLTEGLAFQQYMVRKEMTGISPELSNFGQLYGNSYRAFDWFVKPVVFGYQFPIQANSTSTIIVINNPVSWLLVWPILGALMYFWYRTRAAGLAIAIAGFILLYAPFLMAKRQVLIYSALAVLPLAFLLMAIFFEILRSRSPGSMRSLSYSLTVLIIVVSLAFYPFAIAMPLPNSWAKMVPFQGALIRASGP